MSGERTIKKLTPCEHYAAKYALVFRQRSDNEEIILQARRVNRVVPVGTVEELQLEITISSLGKKRNRSMHSSFILPPELANELAEACLKIRETK